MDPFVATERDLAASNRPRRDGAAGCGIDPDRQEEARATLGSPGVEEVAARGLAPEEDQVDRPLAINDRLRLDAAIGRAHDLDAAAAYIVGRCRAGAGSEAESDQSMGQNHDVEP
jgi:hypothetical protein